MTDILKRLEEAIKGIWEMGGTPEKAVMHPSTVHKLNAELGEAFMPILSYSEDDSRIVRYATPFGKIIVESNGTCPVDSIYVGSMDMFEESRKHSQLHNERYFNGSSEGNNQY